MHLSAKSRAGDPLDLIISDRWTFTSQSSQDCVGACVCLSAYMLSACGASWGCGTDRQPLTFSPHNPVIDVSMVRMWVAGGPDITAEVRVERSEQSFQFVCVCGLICVPISTFPLQFPPCDDINLAKAQHLLLNCRVII